jgi:hypothetical protein
MAQRNIPLNTDTVGYPIFGPEDGTYFYSIKPYNAFTINNVNKDGSAGHYAELGVKDNDLYNLLAVATYRSVVISNTPSTDITLDFTAIVHQVYIDNSKNVNPLYVEYADTAASTSSLQVLSGAKEIVSVNTQKIHVYSVTPASAVIRGWS